MELGIDRLLKGVGNMMASDGSHQHKTLIDKWWGYALESGEILLFLGGVSVFAYCVLRIWDLIMKRINTEKKWFSIPHWLFLTFAIIFAGEMWDILSQNMEYYSYRLPIYALIMLVAMFALKHCNLEEQQIVVAGMVISGLSFIATLMLTNLTVMASLNYMIPAVMVMFIPIIRGIEKIITENRWRKYYSLLFIFCALVIFRNGYLIRSMHCMQSGPFSIVPNYVKSGPAVGVISEWLGPAMFDSALSEWEQYVDEGNSVLMVGTYAFDPLQYLFEDVEISIYSTICTPTYSKKLLEYWTDYPEKYPEVVIVSCWYGDLQIAEDSWIMQWLAQEHPACEYVDGKYWRYYFLQ